MPDAALLLAVLLACYLGFAALAVTQERHWRRAGGAGRPSPWRVTTLRLVGYTTLLVALVVALLRDGPSFGAVLWATAISLGALAVAATLSWRPQWLRPFAAGAPTVSSTSSGRR